MGNNTLQKITRVTAAIATRGSSEAGGSNSAFKRASGEREIKKIESNAGRFAAFQSAITEEEGRKRAIAEESTRLQKEKARKQTIFAGAQENKPLFQKTLGTRSIFG